MESRGGYAASGTARARVSACERRASTTRSACSWTRPRPRTRSGQPVLVLQASELPLDGGTPVVDGAPTCEHGTWTFAGANYKRRATQWRCPTGECSPKSAWIKADRLRPQVWATEVTAPCPPRDRATGASRAGSVRELLHRTATYPDVEQRYLSKNGPERQRYSDPDASWGHRSAVSTRKGGGFYGYRVHAAVCARTGLPLAWQVRSAREHESLFVAALLDTLHRRGFAPETAALDMGYDNIRVHEECEERGCAPVIPLRQTPEVKRGNHGAPTCEHGTWTFAGANYKRRATHWRCPTGRMLAQVRLDQGHPPASADPARDAQVARPLLRTLRRRARIRPLEARVRAGTAPHARTRPRPTSRRLDDARAAQSGARASTSRTARGVAAVHSAYAEVAVARGPNVANRHVHSGRCRGRVDSRRRNRPGGHGGRRRLRSCLRSASRAPAFAAFRQSKRQSLLVVAG